MARYIDSEALTERLRLQFCKDCNNYNEIRCRSCDIDDTIDFIEDAPTADVVEVKHGKWEKRTFIVFDNEIKDSYHCSECNTTWDTSTNYCPYCGAKMDGGSET